MLYGCCGVVDYVDIKVEQVSVDQTTNLVGCYMKDSQVKCLAAADANNTVNLYGIA